MAESFDKKNISANDTLDINELAALNDDISDDFIEQLQSRVSQDAQAFSGKSDDSALFEEIPSQEDNASTEEQLTATTERKPGTPATLNDDLDDNFIKKYKAKLMKQQNAAVETEGAAHTKHQEAETDTQNDTGKKPQKDA